MMTIERVYVLLIIAFSMPKWLHILKLIFLTPSKLKYVFVQLFNNLGHAT